MIDLLKPKKHANEFKNTKKRSCLFCKKQTMGKIELTHGKEACCKKCKTNFHVVKSKVGDDEA